MRYRHIYISFFVLLFSLSYAFACPIHHKRLISLAPDLTEILFALELEEQIVAVSDYSDFPKEAKKKPRVGSFIAPNIEKILSFKPDMVFVREGATPPQIVETLKQADIETLLFGPENEEEIYRTLETVGKKFKKEKKASEFILSMKSEFNSIKKPKNKPRVLVQLEAFPPIVAGRKTLLDRAIALAGGINVAESHTRYPRLQLEAVYQLRPEIVIVPITAGEERKKREIEALWQGVKGIMGIYGVNADRISRASPRFSQGVRELAKIVALPGKP